MLLTTESTAWAVAFSAGLTGGVILGLGITPWALAKVGMIAAIGLVACAKLLRSIRAERVAPGRVRVRARSVRVEQL